MAFKEFVWAINTARYTIDGYKLAELVQHHELALSDIEPHLTSTNGIYKHAALSALGVLADGMALKDFLVFFRRAREAEHFGYDARVDAALEWLASFLPEWWEGMTNGLIRFGAWCAYRAFINNQPVDEAYTVRMREGKANFKYEVLLNGVLVLAFESSERPVSQTAPIQLALF